TVSCTHECLRRPLRIDLLPNRAHNSDRSESSRSHSHPRSVSAEYFERVAMTRTVLILYLAATSLAGPWYCCCSMAQLSSLVKTTKKPAVLAKAAAACPSCCQHAPAKKNKTYDQAPRPSLPCTCQESRPDALVAASVDAGSVVQAAWSLRAWDQPGSD